MAAKRTPLRAVGPDEPAPPALTVTEAASKGTPRQLLVAMRDRVALDVENPNTPSRDLAALTRRLMEISKEIAHIDAQGDEQDGAEVSDGAFDASAI
jgi:hypothetical protein